MINHISIKDFAIIKDTEIDFEDGLNIITGETGSGKSIVIEAVSLALGSRADSSYVRTGCTKAVIQLAGLLDGEEVIITREISSSGKNLCKLNGEIVTLARLNQVSSKMADIHGQYDNQSLLDQEYHIVLLDAYKQQDTQHIKKQVAQLYDSYSRCRLALSKLIRDEKENARKLDFYRFEYDEIKKARLVSGEDAELESRINLLQNSEKIYDNLNQAYSLIYEASPSITESMGTALKSIESISSFSKDIEKLSDELSDLYYRLEDLGSDLRSLKEDVTFSPQELDQALYRLDTIDGLKRKYGRSIEEIIEYSEELRSKLSVSENLDEIKTSMMKELKGLKEKLTDACEVLTLARREKASELEAAIDRELKDLNFNDACVKIAVEPLPEPTSSGSDRVEILITTNKGEPLKPLSKIVSGGETSRIMLAIKNIISSYDNISTLIFDEIDSGISGITASIVGKKLKEISLSHQVICITHLPQIAAAGDHNYKIYKESDDNSTYTYVKALDDEGKVQEIARLLGGTVITDTTLRSARELIES